MLTSDVKYRQVIDSATDFAIVSSDNAGDVTSWNLGAQNILGWTEQEMMGRSVGRFFTPEDVERGRPAEEIALALENGCSMDERWHVRKSGERFWASCAMTPLTDGAGTLKGFVKALRDRTEYELILKQFGVRARAHKNDRVVVGFENQQEVATNVAFTVVGPVTLERVVKPFGAERSVVGDKQQHRFLQALHVVAPGAG